MEVWILMEHAPHDQGSSVIDVFESEARALPDLMGRATGEPMTAPPERDHDGGYRLFDGRGESWSLYPYTTIPDAT